MTTRRTDNQTRRLDAQGQPWEDLAVQLSLRRNEYGDLAWNDLRNLKASYNGGEEVASVAWEAYTLYQGDNFLYGTSLYPSLSSIADDVTGMVGGLLNAPDDATGTVTIGGTESIILAVRAALNWSRENRPVPGVPEIVAPYTAHAAFSKAADLMGAKVVRVPIRDYRADPDAMAAEIGENTIMLVGSAFAYPFGFVDPIEQLSDLAQEHDLWLHVDSCIGGFFLPFAAQLGHSVPAFDFSLPGVSSISADLHKYAYSARGASTLTLRDQELSRFQGFEFADWPTGVFNTPTIAGSRPAGAVVSAWAVMNYMGVNGYSDRVAKIVEARERLIATLDNTEEFVPCGRPQGSVLGICARTDIDMIAVRDGMGERGWHTAALIVPPGLQVLLNYRHGEIVDEFVGDLVDVGTLVRSGELTRRGSDQSYGV